MGASIPRTQRADNPRMPAKPGANIGPACARALFALYLFSRLRGLGLLPIFLDETLHVRWALLIAQGEKPWDATWKWGRALTIWLGALVSPWAEDLLRANRLVSVALGARDALSPRSRSRAGSSASGPRSLAGLFYVLCPFTLFYDRMALTEAGLSAFTALTLLFSIRVAESGRAPLRAVLAGLVARARGARQGARRAGAADSAR